MIPKKVLILGSGGLRIGQAGEFDYSGSQAIKALKEEGVFTILINPNIATVQTDAGLADRVYLQPLNLKTVAKIIAREKPDGILLGFGGQTALNLGMKLDENGILKKYGVKVLGTSVETIKISEDRDLFKQALKEIDLKTPESIAAKTVAEATAAAKKLGYPVMLRAGFSLGGLGSGRVNNQVELVEKATTALSGAPQILIEEYLGGWKELEYEIVRDSVNNSVTVCNMENFDQMGVHTGESIVVAPSQTLNNEEYHRLREICRKIVTHLKIIGECNVQFALNPKTGDYRIIEMNARLSRSSALASKATGYPLAFVAAKLAIGKTLPELKNSVTKKTSAFFEPALDYIAIKIPRWDLTKFKSAERSIGSEMKSVGEVMALGRSFPEAIQKAVRMLNIGAHGLSDYPHKIADLKDEVTNPTDRRLFAIYELFRQGTNVSEVQKLSNIDRWFLSQLESIAKIEKEIKSKPLTPTLLRTAKQFGFSDYTIGKLKKLSEKDIRAKRIKEKILPVVKEIDTLAGEFAAATNYLYTTYHGAEHDVAPSQPKPIIVLGSGLYCIGSSVEFDWCSVNTARALRKNKKNAVIINSNPETVSTDYDESDRLYFEELTQERIADIADFEKSQGIIVSVGGQIANNVALPLARAGYKLLGTSAASIDQAEDREKFSALLNKLKIDQPAWQKVTTLSAAQQFAAKVGYPLLIRPSYVISGTAMNVTYSDAETEKFLKNAADISSEHPVVISQFILNAKELEIDGVAQNGQIAVMAITEHIENAGVHSGDATVVLPPQHLYLETVRRAKAIAKKIASALKISGPFNIQFLAKDNELKVIECNLRASRSFPFCSKVTGVNFIDVAAEILLDKFKPRSFETLELNHIGVKTPQFSYQRVKGANPVAGVEMASTGEVAVIADSYHEAFYLSWLATEQAINGKNILVSIGTEQKIKLLEEIRALETAGWNIYATEHTSDFLANHGIASTFLHKVSADSNPNIADYITQKKIDLIVNIPTGRDQTALSDGFQIRRLAVDHHIPLITNLQIASVFLKCLATEKLNNYHPLSWQEYMEKNI